MLILILLILIREWSKQNSKNSQTDSTKPVHKTKCQTGD